MKPDITKIKWAIKVISKSNMCYSGGIIGAKALDIALDILRQVRDGKLIPTTKGKNNE